MATSKLPQGTVETVPLVAVANCVTSLVTFESDLVTVSQLTTLQSQNDSECTISVYNLQKTLCPWSETVGMIVDNIFGTTPKVEQEVDLFYTVATFLFMYYFLTDI